jgi:hypothetical protein
MLPIIGALLPIVGKIIDKVIPDVVGREAAKMEIQLKLAEQEGELVKALIQSDIAQSEVNKTEAASDNIFKSGWRPAVGWIGVTGLAWTVFLPVISWFLQMAGVQTPPLPQLGGEVLNTLLFGLLGLGGLRTYEKKSGVTK